MSEQDDAFREWWKQATEELRRTSRRSPYYAASLAREAWNAGRQAQNRALLVALEAEEAVQAHLKHCPECKQVVLCDAGDAIACKATAKARRAAIAEAQHQEEAS